MKITLLGTGTPVPSLKRASSSYLLEAGADVILIDHGPGAYARLMQAGRKAEDVTHLFLSHLHFDHCGDVPRLLHHHWDAVGGIRPRFAIYGPAGTRELLERLFGPRGAFHRDLTARTTHPASLRIFQSRGGGTTRPWPDVEATEIADGAVVEGDGWKLEAIGVIHHQPYLESLGFRVTSNGKIFAYTSDVRLSGRQGPVASLDRLARDADVLVHYLNGFDFELSEPGALSSQQVVATLARDAGVKTLVTTHHGPAIDRDGVRERVIAGLAEIYKGRLVWGQDLMTFEL
ncbi:MAG: MBL fold metallo-hydrolase [Burkholderiales bacterium]|nr:MBL fold metallo-hydrolase [Burkholderiales bacterium]